MKILHVLDVSVPIIAGYTIRSKNIVDNQKAIGFDTTVISSLRQSDNRSVGKSDCIGLNYDHIDGISYYRSVDFDSILKRFAGKPIVGEVREILTYSRNIELAAKEIKPDIIHAHSPILVGYAAYKAAKRMGIPFVYEIRALWEDAAVDQGKMKPGDPKYKIIRFLETHLIEKTNATVVICEGLKNEIYGRGIPAEKIFVVPNGVESDKFVPLDKDRALTEKYSLEGKTVVGYIGTLFDFEGVDYLVKAVNAIREREDFVCLIMGYGELEDRIKKLIKELKLENKVKFLGKIPHEQINSHYSIIDILVYPRRSKRITEMVTPLKLLEAMSMGKTVIGSDVGGIKELVSDSHSGILFKTDNVDSLVEKLTNVLDNQDLRKSLGVSARESMISGRNWREIARIYKDVYEYTVASAK